jgi:hypothetical protein
MNESLLESYPDDWALPVESWHFYLYEWIDDLSFMPSVHDRVTQGPKLDRLIADIKARWATMGWDGDGEIQLMWLPPFCFPDAEQSYGQYLLHVKQRDDGISWIASPRPLPWLEN